MTAGMDIKVALWDLDDSDMEGRISLLISAVVELLDEKESLLREIEELRSRVGQLEWDTTDHTIPEER